MQILTWYCSCFSCSCWSCCCSDSYMLLRNKYDEWMVEAEGVKKLIYFIYFLTKWKMNFQLSNILYFLKNRIFILFHFCAGKTMNKKKRNGKTKKILMKLCESIAIISIYVRTAPNRDWILYVFSKWEAHNDCGREIEEKWKIDERSFAICL